MKTLRELTIGYITDYLLNHCKSYGDYIHGWHDARARHEYTVQGLSRASDTILFSILMKMSQQDADIIPCRVDANGTYCDILIGGRIYGGIVEDGSIHT